MERLSFAISLPDFLFLSLSLSLSLFFSFGRFAFVLFVFFAGFGPAEIAGHKSDDSAERSERVFTRSVSGWDSFFFGFVFIASPRINPIKKKKGKKKRNEKKNNSKTRKKTA